MSIRWYVIPADGAEPLVSPLSGAPYIFDAPDKYAALDYVARVFPWVPVLPMSVCEYEAARELKDAAVRAKRHDDALLVYAKTLPVPEEVEEEEAGQMTLCGDPAMWRAA